MPQAPNLPPDQLGQTQANAGLNPVNFLMAAADLQKQGSLSAPVPTGKPLPAKNRPAPKKFKVIK